MNKQRRLQLKGATELLLHASEVIDRVKDEEQDSLDNMPEPLQDSERCQVMENAVSELEEAISLIEQAIESVDRARE